MLESHLLKRNDVALSASGGKMYFLASHHASGLIQYKSKKKELKGRTDFK